eukprot:GEMP01015420.1.p1 GENE.GEMP01015420.1~~GEMP01015420.1.p1  ORF type:complete len:468 (+),score=47.66 GEMP01015420.1:126-1529(+)
MNPSFRKRVLFLLLWVWMALCAGNLYMFASWEVELMNLCHLPAEQLDGVYAAGQLGVGVALIPGILFDKYGYGATLSFATFFLIVGTVVLNAAVHSCDTGSTALGFGFVQHGSTALYQTALFTSAASSSPSELGFTVGVVSAGYGLSAAAWSHVFGLMGRDIFTFINTTGAIWASTALMSLFFFRFVPSAEEKENAEQGNYGRAAVSQTDGLYRPSELRGSVIGKKSRMSDDSIDLLALNDATELSLREILSIPEFWATMIQFVCLQTVGSGLFIANLSLLSGSWGFRNEQRRSLVAFLSCFNAVGRLVAGVAGDRVAARNLPYSRLLLVTGILMAIAVLLCLSPLPEAVKVIATLLVGACYGGNWVILPAHLRSRFGTAHVGVVFNICTTFMAIGVFFMSHLTGEMYDLWKPEEEKDSNGQQLFCHGFNCFRVAFFAALALIAVSISLGLCLGVRSSSVRTVPLRI